ncbi:MAG: cytochrome c oxidase subunit II [Anaerolineae bacterium]|nr:cytochrome c oxidase subunit II [Anaerolineae bacterium]
MRYLPLTHQSPLTRLRRGQLAILSLLLPLLAGCAGNASSILGPSGPAAARINTLWWLMFAVGTVVYLVVMGYLLVGLFRRRGNEFDAAQSDEGTGVVVWGGAVIPAIILVGIFGATVFTMRALDEPAAAGELIIEVEGRQWWWDVRYPGFGFRTANEIHIPVGRPVAVKLLSQDVIHSFWVPQLHGKLDMVPGKVTEFWLQADEPGSYLGECAEFCGVQHAKMQFWVIAQEEDDFLQWVAQQQQPAPQPAAELVQQGQQVFLDSACVDCHAVEGTNATGNLGPDLTHLASRRTLAAGTIPNNRGNLAGWIVDPQSIKPGAKMPPAELTGAQLQALLAYLETLE